MERSEPFDAWDEGGDDPLDMSLYGPAPLPAHERAWRHPSEMGQNAWMLSEPPVAIGRGLLVTTGAIGCVLGIAVLWLLVPIGGGLAPSAAPTVTSSSNAVRPVVTAASEATVQTALLNDAPSTVPAALITLPSEEPPVNTVLVTRPKAPQTSAVAVAVSNGDAPFIVTTANAVADNDGFSMVGSGDPTDGSVKSIEGNLAYLTSNDDLDVVGFTQTASAQVGDLVTVLGQEQTPVQFVVDGGAVVELDAAVVREGTPVIDESGALVALCTLMEGVDGPYVALVPIGSPPVDPTDSTTPTTPTTTPPDESTTTTTQPDESTTTTTVVAPTAWAGIKFGEVDPSAIPAVVGVITDSPAEVSGLLAGDQIVAVDDVAVTRVDEVLAAIKAKQPGDTIVFTVITPPATTTDDTSSTSSSLAPVERSISVVLGVYEPGV